MSSKPNAFAMMMAKKPPAPKPVAPVEVTPVSEPPADVANPVAAVVTPSSDPISEPSSSAPTINMSHSAAEVPAATVAGVPAKKHPFFMKPDELKAATEAERILALQLERERVRAQLELDRQKQSEAAAAHFAGLKANPFLLPRKPGATNTVALPPSSCSSLDPSTFSSWQVPSETPFPHASIPLPEMEPRPSIDIARRVPLSFRNNSAVVSDADVIQIDCEDESAPPVAVAVSPSIATMELPPAHLEWSSAEPAPLREALKQMRQQISHFRSLRFDVAEMAAYSALAASPHADVLLPEALPVTTDPVLDTQERVSDFVKSLQPRKQLAELVAALREHVKSAEIRSVLDRLRSVALKCASNQAWTQTKAELLAESQTIYWHALLRMLSIEGDHMELEPRPDERWWLSSWADFDTRSLWTDMFRPRCPAEMVGNAPQAARLHKWLQAWSAKIDRDRNAALTSALASSSVSFFGANEPVSTTPVSSTNATSAVTAAATEPKPTPVAEPIIEPVAQPEPAQIDPDDEAFEAESSSRSRRFRSRLRRSTVIDDEGDADSSELRNSKKRRAAQTDEDGDDDFAPVRTSRKKAPAAETPAVDPAAAVKDETVYDLDNLFTAMILTGPLGVGKSATVYACARSLGFEVLEINPGTLRSGKAVTALFGEASQSHRIRPGSISAFAALANTSSTPTNSAPAVAASASTTPKEATPTGTLKSMFGAKPASNSASSKADQATLANSKAVSKNSVISMFAKAPATSTSTASAPASASTSAARSNSPSVVVPAPPPRGSIQSFIQRKSAPAVTSVLLEAPAPVTAPIKVDTEPPAKKMFARRSAPLDSNTASTSQAAISLVDSPVLINTPAPKCEPIVVSSTPDVSESGGRRSSRVQHLQQVQSERKEAQAKLEAELEAAKPPKAARKRRQTEDSPTEIDDADEVEITMTICESAKQPPKAPTFKAYFAQLFSDPPAASLFQPPASEAPADALQALLNNKPATTTARKTLIVFEETDTVFDEDQGFYRALKQLIRTTKCPVVMTGNEYPEELEEQVATLQFGGSPFARQLFSMFFLWLVTGTAAPASKNTMLAAIQPSSVDNMSLLSGRWAGVHLSELSEVLSLTGDAYLEPVDFEHLPDSSDGALCNLSDLRRLLCQFQFWLRGSPNSSQPKGSMTLSQPVFPQWHLRSRWAGLVDAHRTLNLRCGKKTFTASALQCLFLDAHTSASVQYQSGDDEWSSLSSILECAGQGSASVSSAALCEYLDRVCSGISALDLIQLNYVNVADKTGAEKVSPKEQVSDCADVVDELARVADSISCADTWRTQTMPTATAPLHHLRWPYAGQDVCEDAEAEQQMSTQLIARQRYQANAFAALSLHTARESIGRARQSQQARVLSDVPSLRYSAPALPRAANGFSFSIDGVQFAAEAFGAEPNTRSRLVSGLRIKNLMPGASAMCRDVVPMVRSIARNCEPYFQHWLDENIVRGLQTNATKLAV